MGIFLASQRGFKLIEIIFIVAIISILATASILHIQDSRKSARDAQRLTDLQQLQVALRVYKDAYGVYPSSGCGPSNWWVGPGPGDATWYSECTDYISGLVPNYIATLPRDPMYENSNNSGFAYHADATGYKVLVFPTEKKLRYQGEAYARCSSSCSVVTYPYCGNHTNVIAIWSDSIPGNGSGPECW